MLRKEVLWWSAVVVISAALGLIFALVVLAVREEPAPEPPASREPAAGSQAPAGSGSAPATPEPATVTITTQPPGALLFTADGTPLGKEPLTLPVEVGSTVAILAKLDGYPPVTNLAENVEAGETITIRLDLFRDATGSAPATKPERRPGGRDDKSRQQGSGSAVPVPKKKGSGYDGNDVVD